MKDKILSDFEKHCEFEDAICDSILIQFDAPLTSKHDYPIPLVIPSVRKVREFIGTAVYQICGNKKGTKRDFYNMNICYEDLVDRKKLSKRILEGLTEVSCEGSEDSIIRRYLWSDYIFFTEWFYMRGDFFAYKDKDAAIKKVNEYFTKKELKDIENIGVIIRNQIKANGIEE